MARKKSGLGRGLAELLGERLMDEETQSGGVEAYESGIPAEDEDLRSAWHSEQGTVRSAPDVAAGREAAIVEIPVSHIAPNPRQPRRSVDRGALEELAKSIESVGIVQPVIVRRSEKGFELIAGERRWRAAQLAGFTVIPAIVRAASDTESLELALVENVVRQQLNPIDEAYALQVLLEDLGVTQETLAAQVGRSRPAIANKVRLLDLPAEVQEMLAAGDLSEGHGRALLALASRGRQLRLARKAVRECLSVRRVEAEVRRLNGKKPVVAPSQRILIPDVLMARAREAFRDALKISPRIVGTERGIRVELLLKNEGELEALIDRLTR